MDPSTFDPTQAVVFDLDRGRVSLDGGESLLLVPASLLAEACAELDPAVVRRLGLSLGKAAGGRIRARLSKLEPPSLELMVDQLAGELSLGGFGALAIERWGRALVVRIDGHPLGGPGQDLLCGFVAGALRVAVQRDVAAMPLERSEASLRLLLCNPAAAVTVESWLLAGGSWSDALAALHRGARLDAGGRL